VLAGLPGTSTHVDSSGTNARFANPTAITFMSLVSQFYVCEASTIRVVTTTGWLDNR
jgi:hypothetical protein